MIKSMGSFDYVDPTADELHLVGWMCEPGRSFDAFDVFLDDEPIGTARAVARADLGGYRLPPGTVPTGFEARLAVPRERLQDWFRLRVVGTSGGVPAGSIETWFVLDFAAGLPVPDEVLRTRVIGNGNPVHFFLSGMAAVGEFLAALRAHRAIDSVRSVLDWGCGCGRLSLILHRLAPQLALLGCDVDPEGVAWCRENIAPGDFRVVPLHPPTSFDAEAADVVLGFSVCSHLTRDDQERWLAELARLLRPGGIALLSVHGEFAAEVHGMREEQRERVLAELARDGISDFVADTALDAVAPSDFYRGTFQTEAYTRATWSRHLQVLAYHPRAMMGFQDLVVLRKS